MRRQSRLLAGLGLVAGLIAAQGVAQGSDTKTVTIDLISPQGIGAPIGKITLQDSAGGLMLTPDLKGLPPGAHRAGRAGR